MKSFFSAFTLCLVSLRGLSAKSNARCTDGENNCAVCAVGFDGCSYCENNYHITAEGECVECPGCLYGCLNVEGDCCAEETGGCRECDKDATKCSGCAPGYYMHWDDYKCYQCHELCDTCASAYIAENDTSIDECCPNYCATCSGDSNLHCLQCYGGAAPSGDLCNCQEYSGSPCVRCGTGTQCLECKTGYSLLTTGECVKCPGTCADTNAGCSASHDCCVEENCAQCDTNTTCTKCNATFYLEGTGPSATCEACSNLCAECGAAGCTKCQKGYYLEVATCEACDAFCEFGCDGPGESGCILCVEGEKGCCANYCATCSGGSNLHCLQCYGGAAPSGGLCNCQEYSGSPCVRCGTGTQCLECKTGYSLLTTGECVKCPETCADTNAGCSASHDCCVEENCVQCDTNTTCSKCNTGFYLEGTGPSAICEACSNLCAECGAAGCTKCQKGYYLEGSGTTATCEACDAACEFGCDGLGESGCILCVEGEGGCDICDSTNTECIVCDHINRYSLAEDPTKCIQCDVSCSTVTGCSAEASGNCCDLQKCGRCDRDKKTCGVCQENHFMSGCASIRKCEPCDSSCANGCFGPLPSECCGTGCKAYCSSKTVCLDGEIDVCKGIEVAAAVTTSSGAKSIYLFPLYVILFLSK